MRGDCNACGAQLPVDAKTCPGCGAAVPAKGKLLPLAAFMRLSSSSLFAEAGDERSQDYPCRLRLFLCGH